MTDITVRMRLARHSNGVLAVHEEGSMLRESHDEAPRYYLDSEAPSSAVCMALELASRRVGRGEARIGERDSFTVKVELIKPQGWYHGTSTPPVDPKAPVNSLLGTDLEIRSFRIRNSRVHVTAPGLHGTDDRWHVYYSPEATELPVKVAPVATFGEALQLARKLASIYDAKVSGDTVPC